MPHCWKSHVAAQMCFKNTFSAFQYLFETDMVSSGPNNNHWKITHFSVENSILYFLTTGHPLDRLVSDLQNNLQPTAFSITTENFGEFEEKRQKL